MEENDIKAEEKILEAATEVFIQKGLTGARMQEIADKAGINKALLHYYYRSKDRLFESVFGLVLKKLIVPEVLKIMREEEDIFMMIRKFTSVYVSLLCQNPHIPIFVLEELQKNPERMPKLFMNAGIPTDEVIARFEAAMEQGLVRRMDPRQIMVNLIALCIFPFAAQNLMRPVLFKDSKKDYKAFLESRKTEIADFIIHSIKTNSHAD